jgi:hypothetical protein
MRLLGRDGGRGSGRWMKQELQLTDRLQDAIQIGIRLQPAVKIRTCGVDLTPYLADLVWADLYALAAHAGTVLACRM